MQEGRLAAASRGAHASLIPAILLICTLLVYLSAPFNSRRTCAATCSTNNHSASSRGSGSTGGRSSTEGNKTCAVALPPEVFFAVQGFGFTDTIGGITVLHFLIDRLNRLYGQLEPVAFLVGSTVTNPAWATPLLPPWRNTTAPGAIAVYPEITWGNPLNSPHVIRWVLWFPGGHSGPTPAEYDPQHLVGCYSPGMCTEFGPAITMEPLRLIEYGFGYLQGLPLANKTERNGTLVYHGKDRWRRQGTNGPFQRNYTHFSNITGTVIPNSMPKRQRLEAFARADTFISFDAGTWRNVEAAMVGAKSIVLPVEGVSKQEWITSVYGAEEMQYGVAYGEDDLPHAIATQHMLLPTLQRRAQEQETELRQFVAKACKFFKMSCRYESC